MISVKGPLGALLGIIATGVTLNERMTYNVQALCIGLVATTRLVEATRGPVPPLVVDTIVVVDTVVLKPSLTYLLKYVMTRATCVCCSMISETHT